MTALPNRTVTAESIRLLNESFDARLKANKAKPRSAIECHIHTQRADALMRAARALEAAAQEINP